MTFVKLCGMVREQDVDTACELGAQAVGFVLWPGSPRSLPLARLAPLVKRLAPGVLPVGVFVAPAVSDVQAAADAGVRVVQLHGVERWSEAERPLGPIETWVARPADADLGDLPADVRVVLDAHDPVRHGGTGRTIDWARAAIVAAERPIVLAGGLTPGNVASAVRQVRPFGVDVASGIEDRPGVKSAQAMRAFVAAVREAE